jgi:hypothetical protein
MIALHSLLIANGTKFWYNNIKSEVTESISNLKLKGAGFENRRTNIQKG